MEIITGYTGKPHVTAEQDRDVNEGIFDTGSFVLKTGSQLAAELVSNNEIKVRDGVLVIQGCTAVIKKNTYDPVTIANGSQGMKRIDLIVARYNKNEETKIEEVTLKVIQGTPNASTAAVPTYKTGDIQSGDLVADMPLYKVTLDGLNVTSVDKMFTVIPTLPELSSNLTNANAKISALSTELATTNTNLKTATADSGWKYMTANNLSEKLKFRKIGHVVFVAGSIRFSDNGKFANDQYLGNVPSGMTPNGYNTYECLIPIAMHNGGPAGTQARIYIKNGGVYISGTDSASFVMIATTAYFS
ncbi:hypothetical protein [Coprococcus comes]|uniref:hypothetical protein n=2 Tax=Coprococcus comes TaxID=410072 RepID=UPI001D0603FE|nr:hypothetical protein [Coprococcus comes]MCB6474349.1 hypothetical protein [Coprococcus comes]